MFRQLGLYAAASKIYEGWIMLPYVLSLSLLPLIIKQKKDSPKEFSHKFTQVIALLFWLSVFVALITLMFGETLITVSFGENYIQSHMSLVIIMWGAPFSALGNIVARYMVAEKIEKKIMVRTWFGLLINILLNLILIPTIGIEGAAIATVVSLFFI